MTDTAVPHARHHDHKGLALAVISIAQLMVVLDATVVNVALTSIRADDLGFTNTSLRWVITAYSLAFGGLLLFGGRTGDLFGRRRMFLFGVGLFGFSSLLGGLAQSGAWLIAARALQGVGGAIAAPTALALIATTFDEGDERNRAFGVYAAMAASGGALGLLLGGILTDLVSWRWTLFINAPIALFVLLVGPRVLGESQGAGTRLDIPGVITATGGMTALVYGFSRAADSGWGDSLTLTALAVAAILLTVFVLVERRVTAPLLPLRMLANRNRSGAYLAMLLLACAMFTTFFFASQYQQEVHGWSPMRTGIGFLPMPATIMFMSLVVVRRLIPRIGTRPFLTVGPLFAVASMLVMSTLDVDSSYLHFLAGLLLLGFGMGCVFVPLTVTAVTGVHHHESGLASALLNTGQQVGGAIGLSVLGTIAAHVGRDRAHELAQHGRALASHDSFVDTFVHAQSAAFLGGAVCAALAFVATAVLIRTQSPRAAAAAADAIPAHAES